MIGIEMYTLGIICWTFFAGWIQCTVPKYRDTSTGFETLLGLTLNYVFAPICVGLAYIHWMEDLEERVLTKN